MLLADPVTEKTRSLTRLHRLEQLTGLRLNVVGLDWPRFMDRDLPAVSERFSEKLLEGCRRHPWTPQFAVISDATEFGVGISSDSAIVGRRTIRSAAEQELFRRMVAISISQLRSEEELRQKDAELECLVDHVSRLYEQIHGIFQVSRALSLAEPFETILEQIEQSSPGTLSADQLCVLSVPDATERHEDRLARHCSGETFADVEMDEIAAQLSNRAETLVLLTSRDLYGSRFGSVLAVPLPHADTRSWLVATRLPGKPDFGSEEASYLLSVAAMLESHLKNSSLYAEKDEMLLLFVRSLVHSLDARDHDTQGHSMRVAAIARILAECLGLPEEEVELIHTAGLLHDIGKIGISDAVLKKTDTLTAGDWEEIKRHPVIGYEILSGLPQLSGILPGVRNHHERIDGQGYPDGLAGEEIPLMARILAVADAFDAMLSNRSYRRGLPGENVDRVLAEGAGTHWDIRVVEAYFACHGRIHDVWRELMEADRNGDQGTVAAACNCPSTRF